MPPGVGSVDALRRRALAVADALSVLAALACALLVGGRADFGARLLWGLAAIPLMVVLFKVYGLYDRDMKRFTHATVDDLPWLFHATLVGVLAVWLYSKVGPMGKLDFVEVLVFGALTMGLATLARAATRAALGRIAGPEAALLVGEGRMAHVLAAKLEAHAEYGSTVVGVLADGLADGPPMHGLPVLGPLERLDQVVAEHRVGRVIVAPGGIADSELEALLHRCRDLLLKVSLLPKLSDVLGPAVEVDDVEGVAVLGINPPWLPRSSRALKRVMDLVLAVATLVLTLPLLALVAVAIKLDSPGPVLFYQERIGKGGRPFRLYKLRTMTVDAERRREGLLTRSSDPNWLLLDRDPRVTRVGRRLRRLSLDELPQLWNVLRGEMSLVGPRPLIAVEDRRVQSWARGRLDLTPGITGYWQVLGRTRIPFEEMVKLDYLYVMNWSLWTDLKLIIRTLPTLVSGRGAN
ncbi:MAG: sugar transferase [Solirubrobacterales bacterium]|nr:sugar transferase [Solirubrobacterales bacterium]MBV9166090.1 sugar transferase [Solirubrobacterales bacterium]